MRMRVREREVVRQHREQHGQRQVVVVHGTLLPAQARGCRKLSAYRIVTADLYAVSVITPYAEYRQWVASLPRPGRVWRALGAPTPQQRLRILHEFRARR